MILLGVERAFSFSISNHIRFRSNRGDSPFRTIELVDTRSFTDVYYDLNTTLQRNGIWIRTRDGTWLAKKRVRGDPTYPSFMETNELTIIQSLVRAHFHSCPGVEAKFGLREQCRVTIHRESYVVDRKYLVSLDIRDFGYVRPYLQIVGLIQLIAENDPAKIRMAHKEIDDFILQYAWFFNSENI